MIISARVLEIWTQKSLVQSHVDVKLKGFPGHRWSDMRSAFRGHARKALKWLGYGNWTVKHVLEAGPRGPASSTCFTVQFP